MSSDLPSNEIFNTFVDQFTHDADVIEVKIGQLKNPDSFDEAVNALFRIFHNHKALTSFLKLEEIHKCVKKAENVLNILRQDGEISDEAQLDWLYLLERQMYTWADELDLGLADLSPANEDLYTTLKLQKQTVSINDILADRHLLYIDNDSAGALKFLPTFEKIFAKVTSIGHADDLKNTLQAHRPDLIIMSQSFINTHTYSILHSCNDIIPTVALTEKATKKDIIKLINQGVHYYINKPVSGTALKKVLHSIVKTHFTPRKMIISNKKIRAFIETLDPLSDTILKIQQVCDNDNTSISDLIQVVKSDPITSGMILNATKSPIYALKNITTVDQAVSIFGKRTVKALTLGGLSGAFQTTNLSMYGINESIFKEISQMRMKLINNWAHSVAPDDSDILNVAALLGNIGQMLIAKEIAAQQKESVFYESIQQKGVLETEYDFLRTSTAAVSSDILYFWKMPPTLIDIISYSNDPKEAVEEIKPLSLICHVVFELVPLTEATILPVSENIKKLLLENELDVTELHIAIENTLDNKSVS
jgi:HD-like signal output (HDOD) protein/CheY-like chemotaxis protein